ncbi:MAG TPA: DUF6080 domain-containing protein [Micropepsaceae bacterium]|nr:DUF6080 domain-containing protein [Micropepsaceae bacterium]
MSKLKTIWDTIIIGSVVFLFHIWNVPAAAAGTIFRKSNLAFDFDIDRFVQLWCTSPFPVDQNEDYYAVRHPLAVAVRIVCLPITRVGVEAHIAACGIAAICAALSAVLTFRIALALGVQRWPAYVLTALWAVSTTSLLLGVLPETYDLAFVALGYQFLLAIRWIQGHRPAASARMIVTVANFGITITNVALSGLAELVCRMTTQPFRKAFMGAVGFGAIAGAIALILSVASFEVWPVKGVDNPIGVIKQVYWSAAAAETTTARQSVGDVAWTLGATAFVAPALARYPSGVPTNPYLWDLRGQNYSAVGWAAVLGWLGLLLLGAAAAAREREFWPIWIVALLWAVGNVGLHSYWQFRDSVFLYAAHSHIAFFLFVLAGAKWAQGLRPNGGLAYAGFVAALTVLVAMNNLPVYFALPVLT